MTIMIPSTIVRQSTPRGETELFKKLQGAHGTDGWIALHSFDLARHETKTQGEIDMILLIPDLGILCVEVKGVGLSRIDGAWKYADGREPDAGPFVQASGAMHSIRKSLASINIEYGKLLFYSAVIFPTFEFKIQSLEWNSWQVIDKPVFNSLDFLTTLKSILEKAHKEQRRLGKQWYDPNKSRPDKKLCGELAEVLRPNFEFNPGKRTAIENITNQISIYTEEQIESLNSWGENPRVLVEGPAGTGKTVIAAKAFKISVSNGEKVALICFNKFLNKKLSNDLMPFVQENNATCSAFISTFHNLLLNITGIKAPKHQDNLFWKEDLPEMALEKLLCDSNIVQNNFYGIEKLIVDEAQDLMLPQYLDCLEALMAKSLSESEWLFLGDFYNQTLYECDIAALRSRAPNYSQIKLTKNCRNAGQVVDQINSIFQIKPAYGSQLPELDGAEAKLLFWNSREHQTSLIESALNRHTERFFPNEIVLLSPYGKNPASATLKNKWREHISYSSSDLSKNENKVKTSTIHAFKGLESPVVLITDIDDLSDKMLDLLYVAISRSTVCVNIFLHHKLKKRWKKILGERLYQ